MRKFLLLISYCFALTMGQAQNVDVSLPRAGSVFQRDNNGSGTIQVAGTLNSLSFKSGFFAIGSQLKALDVKTGNPLSGDPINVSLTRDGSTFSGSASVPAGWYELKVYTFNFTGFSFRFYTSPAIRVGVGEVFIIAGQGIA